MISVHSKITKILLLVLLSIGITISSYLSYFSYQNYNDFDRTTTVSSLIKNIQIIIDKLWEERIQSAIYMSKQDEYTLLALKETWTATDTLLTQTQKIVDNQEQFRRYGNRLRDVERALHEAREKVIMIDSSYREIFYEIYHQRVTEHFFEILDSLSSKPNIKWITEYLLTYNEFTMLKEQTILEDSMISYVLLSSKPMDKKDVALWARVIQQSTLPKLSLLKNEEVIEKISENIDKEAFQKNLLDEREMIRSESSVGNYSVTHRGWTNQIYKRADYIDQSLSILYHEIEFIDLMPLYEKLIWAGGYGIVALLLLIVWIKEVYRFFSFQENQRIDEKISKDIDLIFDRHQQEELKNLIERGKSNLIFMYVLKAIKDGNTTKDLFIASMSHEIRTPLNGILGFTQLLKESHDPKEQQEFISVIEKSSEHLLSIVNDILDLSKIKAQKIELEMIEFDPIDKFEIAVESYAAKSNESNIDFKVFIDPYLPTLLVGDPTKISQILVNLISNAIKFTPKNGEVSIKVEKIRESSEQVEVRFSVSDTGIGITKDQQSRIFEAFSQADVSTSRKYGGTGLGLSISGRLVDMMGGKLSIESVPDEGSTFFFTLMLQKASKASIRQVRNFNHLTVGILGSPDETKAILDKNLELYLNYIGVTIKHYTERSILAIKHEKQKLPDILFIEHKYRQRDRELDPFIDIDTKIVLITTTNQKNALKAYSNHISKILYKPVNFTKTLRVLSNQVQEIERKEIHRYENVHVLVAEDNSINQKLITNVLNRMGIEVTIANNGKEALEARLNQPNLFDIIFMDIEMPVMGGMEATAQILGYEKSNNLRHIPIVALTANALTTDRSKYLGAGMDDYLSKPIEIERINAILERYFSHKIVY